MSNNINCSNCGHSIFDHKWGEYKCGKFKRKCTESELAMGCDEYVKPGTKPDEAPPEIIVRSGATFTPVVNSLTGVLSWTNDKGLPNPSPVNIMGPPGKTGDPGPQGEQGPQGIPGKDGADGVPGKDGHTPVKGVDYLTEDEKKNADQYIRESIEQALSQAKASGEFNGKDGAQGEPGPQGIPGKDGKNGIDGHTPIKGIDYFDGVNGKDGIDGYTPIKGTDYFTEADKQEIAEQAAEMVDIPDSVVLESELTAKGYQTEAQVTALINNALGVIENGTY